MLYFAETGMCPDTSTNFFPVAAIDQILVLGYFAHGQLGISKKNKPYESDSFFIATKTAAQPGSTARVPSSPVVQPRSTARVPSSPVSK